ncbi:hypothetical protein [Bradyrhizobium sp. RDM4]|uniref:hypothetical protein n=1 Tax=Bradyrhizobium sp. RDM4 TaxID=3378765 RepID=UPI0038FC79BB
MRTRKVRAQPAGLEQARVLAEPEELAPLELAGALEAAQPVARSRALGVTRGLITLASTTASTTALDSAHFRAPLCDKPPKDL